MSAAVRGPQLPAYETDTLAWVAQRLRVTHMDDDPVYAEILTGESAILLRFPSGGERILYLDEQPHQRGVPVSFLEAESIRDELDEAQVERDEARRLEAEAAKDLEATHTVIRNARALLEKIAAGDQAEPAPAWLRGEAYTLLRGGPVP